MRVLKTVLTITAKGGLSMAFAVILVLGVLALDKSFNLVSKLTGSPQVAAVSSPPLTDKFCDDPAGESQTGCTSFIPSVLAAASAPYQDVSGNVNISGNVKFGAGSYLYSSVADNFTLQTGTNSPNPNLTIGYGNGTGAGNIDRNREFFSMNAGKFMFQNGLVGIGTNNPTSPLQISSSLGGARTNAVYKLMSITGNSSDGGYENVSHYGLSITPTFAGNYGHSTGYGLYLNPTFSDGASPGFGTKYSFYNASGEKSYFAGPLGIGIPPQDYWGPGLIVKGPIRAGAGNNTDCDIYIGDDVCFRDDQNGSLNVYHYSATRWAPVNALSFSSRSSRDIKKDITELSDKDFQKMAETLRKLSMFTFRYNTEDESHSLHTGIIAEESPASILSDDQKGVNLYDYASLALGAFKAQQKEIEELKAGNQKLQEQIDFLKEEIRALKAK